MSMTSETLARYERAERHRKVLSAIDCATCFDDAVARGEVDDWERWMFLCPECGNKRCPKATWHGAECTLSNEPGQAGSNYKKWRAE
jgi:phage terminase large subunit GpA-like protein